MIIDHIELNCCAEYTIGRLAVKAKGFFSEYFFKRLEIYAAH